MLLDSEQLSIFRILLMSLRFTHTIKFKAFLISALLASLVRKVEISHAFGSSLVKWSIVCELVFVRVFSNAGPKIVLTPEIEVVLRVRSTSAATV